MNEDQGQVEIQKLTAQIACIADAGLKTKEFRGKEYQVRQWVIVYAVDTGDQYRKAVAAWYDHSNGNCQFLNLLNNLQLSPSTSPEDLLGLTVVADCFYDAKNYLKVKDVVIAVMPAAATNWPFVPKFISERGYEFRTVAGMKVGANHAC